MKNILESKISEYLKTIETENIQFKLEVPKKEGFGDYSTNIALILSKQINKNPKIIAEEIISFLDKNELNLSKIEIAGPGFINFFISDSYYFLIIDDILNNGDDYGRNSVNEGKSANIEWVSANPTGPLHAGHGRQVCLGKAISNILEWNGYTVLREYYYNDAGNQMNNLANSVYACYKQLYEKNYPFPEDGYHGEYIKEIANEISKIHTRKFLNNPDLEYFKTYAEEYNFNTIKNSLKKFEIKHDIFYNESDLYKTGKIKDLLEVFAQKGISYEKDNAVWLRMDKGKFDKDKVIVKSSGEPTYRLPDIAYHIDKIKRGYDMIIDIFGADHGDTYKEVLYGIESAGYKTDNIKVIIHQMVTFKSGDRAIKMSKRSDNVYYLDDLIDDVGIDATQFFFVMRSPNTHLDFDIELAKQQSEKNPVYYLQYAHARICGILRNSEKITKGGNTVTKINNINDDELNLLKHLSLFPDLIKDSVESYEPHRIITYLISLAEKFHLFYHNHRIIKDSDIERSLFRINICKIVKQVLKNGFNIIGISAPERM